MTLEVNDISTFIQKVLNDPSLEKDIPEIIENFSAISIAKQEFIVNEGEVCQFFCFIQSGILQHSIIVLGEEKTTYLGLKNTVTTALNSFKNRTPARKSIRALSNCQLQVLSIERFEKLLKTNNAFKNFYFNLIEKQIFLIDDYRIDLLTLTPEERYHKLLENEPYLLKEVPLQYLSSFLGISTRHMSRIRKNIN